MQLLKSMDKVYSKLMKIYNILYFLYTCTQFNLNSLKKTV